MKYTLYEWQFTSYTVLQMLELPNYSLSTMTNNEFLKVNLLLSNFPINNFQCTLIKFLFYIKNFIQFAVFQMGIHF